MAEVQGFLREDATHGERVVLKNLKNNLPRDFTVYVECPLLKEHFSNVSCHPARRALRVICALRVE